MVDQILDALAAYKFNFQDEAGLQDGIAEVLTREGLPFKRERVFGNDRIDFFIGEEVGLEVKVDGSRTEVSRQLHRYAQRAEIKALILFSTRQMHYGLPYRFNGKPCRYFILETF